MTGNTPECTQAAVIRKDGATDKDFDRPSSVHFLDDRGVLYFGSYIAALDHCRENGIKVCQSADEARDWTLLNFPDQAMDLASR